MANTFNYEDVFMGVMESKQKINLFGCDVSKKAINYARKFGNGKVAYTVIKRKIPIKK